MTVTDMPGFQLGMDDDPTDPLAGLIHPADQDGPVRPGPAAGDDPAAPYGRKADGSPRAKPGRKPGPSMTGTRRTTPRPPTTAAPAPPLRPAGPPRPPKAAPKAPKTAAVPDGPDYRPGLHGLFQVVSAPLIVAGLRNDAAAADAAALTMHATPIAEAVNDLALSEPRVANVLDRLLAVGPYGALLAAVLPLAAQVAANHRVLPQAIAAGFGASDPALLTQRMRGDLMDRIQAEAGAA